MTEWPPTDPDTVLACTAWMENRSGGTSGMQSVINAVQNRVKKARWWGDDIVSVCLKPYQFSSWNVGSTQIPLVKEAMTNGDTEYAIALNLSELAIKGILPDLTVGADSYYAVPIDAPSWAAPPSIFTVEIEGQRFYRTVDL